MDEVTFIIKTLERPYCLYRLMKSILKYYPNARILIGDDSKITCREGIKQRFPQCDITVYELPHDCGISYGRNYLIQRVKTPYFVLLDDDFVFDRKTKVEEGLWILKEREYDIIGGFFRNYPVIRSVIDYPLYFGKLMMRGVQKKNYTGFIEEKGEVVKVRYYTKCFPKCETVDIVHNFFIGKTEKIRETCLWDESIKIHEHTPYFIKAKRKGIRIGFTNKMSVKHKPIRPKEYRQYRERDYIRDWMKLYGFSRFVSVTDNGEEHVIINE